jgi:hypothetical protein
MTRGSGPATDSLIVWGSGPSPSAQNGVGRKSDVRVSCATRAHVRARPRATGRCSILLPIQQKPFGDWVLMTFGAFLFFAGRGECSFPPPRPGAVGERPPSLGPRSGRHTTTLRPEEAIPQDRVRQTPRVTPRVGSAPASTDRSVGRLKFRVPLSRGPREIVTPVETTRLVARGFGFKLFQQPRLQRGVLEHPLASKPPRQGAKQQSKNHHRKDFG